MYCVSNWVGSGRIQIIQTAKVDCFPDDLCEETETIEISAGVGEGGGVQAPPPVESTIKRL